MGEREDLEAVGLRMRRREEWGAVYPDYGSWRSIEFPASQLFLHITVTSPHTRPDPDVHARYVERIGIGRFPTVGLSYNALVLPGGLLYEGQPLVRRGAHTVNDFGRDTCPAHGGSLKTKAGLNNLNYSARSCALARMVTDEVTADDVEACAQWGAALIKSGYATPDAVWHGHRCVSSKSCPGPIGYALIPDIEQRMKVLLQGDDTMKEAIAAMKLFGTPFWTRCKAVTGQPGGDPAYWGGTAATKPNDAEWTTAYPVLWPAALLTLAAGVADPLTAGEPVRIVRA